MVRRGEGGFLVVLLGEPPEEELVGGGEADGLFGPAADLGDTARDEDLGKRVPGRVIPHPQFPVPVLPNSVQHPIVFQHHPIP